MAEEINDSPYKEKEAEEPPATPDVPADEGARAPEENGNLPEDAGDSEEADLASAEIEASETEDADSRERPDSEMDESLEAVAAEEAPSAEDSTPTGDDAAEEPTGPEKHWYIIHTYSGFEQKVADSLRGRSEAFGYDDRLGQILIPTEEVVELKSGKKVTSKRLLYPGYVLVELAMDDELWHVVKATPRVTGFVGGGRDPVPLTADEVNQILYRQASSADRPRPKLNFEKNETVRIIDGPFSSFSGKVDEVNPERNTLRVLVTIFGRATPVELDFLQVEKL